MAISSKFSWKLVPRNNLKLAAFSFDLHAHRIIDPIGRPFRCAEIPMLPTIESRQPLQETLIPEDSSF